MNVKYYLCNLINQGHFWQHTDVNGNGQRPKFYFLPFQWLMIILSVFITLYYLPKGFNDTFVGYIIASLSIFVGLFLTLILTVYDKFQKIDFSLARYKENDQIELIRLKNFFKQFTSLTTYSILLSIISILLLSFFILFKFSTKEITINIAINSTNDLKQLVKILILLFHRITTLYFLLDFVIITIYAITSIYSFIISEFDKIKLKPDNDD